MLFKRCNQIVVVALLFLFLAACSSSSQKRAQYPNGRVQMGIASYYADKYQNRQTASGELFNQSARTAAHRTLPFGTLVRVTNIENGRSIVVRINDRGPFIKGRIIDLSKSAFSAIGNTRQGVIKVAVEIIH